MCPLTTWTLYSLLILFVDELQNYELLAVRKRRSTKEWTTSKVRSLTDCFEDGAFRNTMYSVVFRWKLNAGQAILSKVEYILCVLLSSDSHLKFRIIQVLS